MNLYTHFFLRKIYMKKLISKPGVAVGGISGHIYRLYMGSRSAQIARKTSAIERSHFFTSKLYSTFFFNSEKKNCLRSKMCFKKKVEIFFKNRKFQLKNQFFQLKNLLEKIDFSIEIFDFRFFSSENQNFQNTKSSR